MDKLFQSFLELFTIILAPLGMLVRAVIAVLDWPSTMLGIRPEIMAVILCCVVLIAFWRALGPVIK